MTELIKINYNNEEQPMVSARELHDALEIKTQYTKWFVRMCEYGFTENIDYILVSQKSLTNNPKNPYTTITDHNITISMAKEICMLQRNEKGKEFRKYFIDVEKAWNDPDMIMKRALEISNRRVEKLLSEVNIMKPKAVYFDGLVDKKNNTGIRETAKELGVKQNEFVKFLIEHKYLYRNASGKLLPTAQSTADGLMELKEWQNEKRAGNQTFITPKGKQKFMEMITNV